MEHRYGAGTPGRAWRCTGGLSRSDAMQGQTKSQSASDRGWDVGWVWQERKKQKRVATKGARSGSRGVGWGKGLPDCGCMHSERAPWRLASLDWQSAKSSTVIRRKEKRQGDGGRSLLSASLLHLCLEPAVQQASRAIIPQSHAG